MIIALIFFVLIFPVKLSLLGKLSLRSKQAFLYLLIYKFNIISIRFFINNDFIYYKINRSKPKKLNNLIPQKSSKNKRRFNFIVLQSINVHLNLQTSNPSIAPALVQSLRIISPAITHFKDIKLNLSANASFIGKSGLKLKITAFTNLFYLLISLLERIVKSIGVRKEM